MNKLLSTTIILGAAIISLNTFADEEDADKVLVCHNSEKNLLLGAPGLSAHLEHGDTKGPCEELDNANGSEAVVLMHCEAVEGALEVTAYSRSVEFAAPLSDIGEGSDCADALAALLANGFSLESVTGETDYLLRGDID